MSDRLIVSLQLVDLGEPAYSEGSESGCRSQEMACRRVVKTCREHGRCEGGVEQPECKCEPGWSGYGCQLATIPTTLRASSYVRIALSFTPPPHLLTVQLRLRTQGAQDGQLVLVKTYDDVNALSIHVSYLPLYIIHLFRESKLEVPNIIGIRHIRSFCVLYSCFSFIAF